MGNYNHVMVDIETLDTISTASILSIAAIKFNPNTGEIGEKFQRYVSLQSCLDLGLTINENTLSWWAVDNSDTFKTTLVSKRYPLAKVLVELSSFLKDTTYLWGNSAKFDLGILENAYITLALDRPWNPFNERDVRTAVAFSPGTKKDTPFKGTRHDSLDDCRHQIKYLHKILKTLKVKL